MSAVPYWWEYLNHGGMLIGPAQLEEHYLGRLPELSPQIEEKLRRAALRLDEGDSNVSGLLDTVLEDLLGLENGRWDKAPLAHWSHDAITKDKIRPRRVWSGPNDAVLPVFDPRSVYSFAPGEKIPRIGVGRGRQMAARVVEWLRQDNRTKIALLTTGRQWRLIHAGETFDAWCEWDTSLWFSEGKPGPQVEALRQLLGRDSVVPMAAGERCRLETAILDSRQGETELSAALGERVRLAVEKLIQSVTGDLDKHVGEDSSEHYNEIYLAATRMVMRIVVALFAEAREMLPVGEEVYRSSYSVRDLREQFEGLTDDTLRDSHAGWPRLIALFRVLYEGSDHGLFTVVRYGGRLFEPGNPDSADPVVRSIAVLERSDGLSDLQLKEILSLLTRTFTKLRYRKGARPFAVPVDFSAMDTEYIGILYEGLLDFNLKRAAEPIIFLQIGDYPALPWSSLRDMEERRLQDLLENLKKKSTLQVSEDNESGDDDTSTEDDGGELTDLMIDDVEPVTVSTAEALDQEVYDFAVKAVKAAGIVKLGRGKRTPERLRAFEDETRAKARSLFRIVRKGEWYLVRFGNTRKGSGTFYTRPQLAAPTVRRTLKPLCYREDATPRSPEEILALKVCDPAMGSGSFLISSVRYLTNTLLASLYHYDRVDKRPGEWITRLADGLPALQVSDETMPIPGKHEDAESRLKARLRRYIVERCIYGVDIDEMAVELGRMALWIETMDRELPFGFLDHKIKAGNSLVGCWFDRFEDYPATAWLREGGDKDHTFVNAGRANWTKTIANHLNNTVKPALKRFIGLNKQSAFGFVGAQDTPAMVHDEAMRLLEEMHELPIHDVEERKEKYDQIRQSSAFLRLQDAFDTWCALWFWPGDQLPIAPTADNFLAPGDDAMEIVRSIRNKPASRFFHWELEFPDVFGGRNKGFDAVVGNPPWEIQKPNSKEFFSNLDPLYRGYGKTEAETEQKRWFQRRAEVEWRWLDERARLKALSNWVKNAGRPFGNYTRLKSDGTEEWIFAIGRGFDDSAQLHELWRKLRRGRSGYADTAHPFLSQGSADLNTYKMFLEGAYRLLHSEGRMGFIVPSGVYSDKGSRDLRTLFLDKSRWEWLFAFENRNGIFDIHRSFKFAPVIVQKGHRTEVIQTAFMQRSLADWEDAEKFALEYPRDRVLQFSPYSKAILEIRHADDLLMLTKMYSNGILLGSSEDDGWEIRYTTEFHMTNDARKSLFRDRGKWEQENYVPDEYGHWLKGGWRQYSGPRNILERKADLVLSRDRTMAIHSDDIENVALPLYEGRMVGQFDFSQKGWVSGKGRSAQWEDLPFEAKVIKPQFLMDLDTYTSATDREGNVKAVRGFKLGFMDVSSSTNQRTMISSLIGDYPCGNKVPVLGGLGVHNAIGVGGVLNSFCYDYHFRQRLAGLTLNWFILAESCTPKCRFAPDFVFSCLRIGGVSESFAAAWLPFRESARAWRGLWHVTEYQRLQARSMLDAAVTFFYGLDETEFRRILRDCDHPVADTMSDEFTRRLDPKGFWRVDKEKPPELRHTILAQVAFRDLQIMGLEEFFRSWTLPEALRLKDYDLGQDSRANDPQPVAPVLGDWQLEWQTSQGVEESWQECARHAELLSKIVPPQVAKKGDLDNNAADQFALNLTDSDPDPR
jgi:hypothetical protein